MSERELDKVVLETVIDELEKVTDAENVDDRMFKVYRCISILEEYKELKEKEMGMR